MGKDTQYLNGKVTIRACTRPMPKHAWKKKKKKKKKKKIKERNNQIKYLMQNKTSCDHLFSNQDLSYDSSRNM
jgi:hypothetical protein